ncbi:MAG: PEP-CTERM sorting domain-containing protein, partial [Planctomycetota bacterium]
QGGSDDWLRFNGQIAIRNFTGDGTYTIGPGGSDAGGIYYVSPLLNRVETDTWRTNTGVTGTNWSGIAPADGDPTANEDDVYLPDFSPNGTATVTISGTAVSINYGLDFSTLPITNAEFFRGGSTPTEISDILTAEGAFLSFIGVDGSGTAVVEEFLEGADGDAPFGGYNALDEEFSPPGDPISPAIGNLSNTLIDTNYEFLREEIADGTIARSTSDPTLLTFTGPGATNPDLAPFLDGAGTTTFFDLTGGAPLDGFIATAIPEPGTFSALVVSGALVATSRRRRRN